MKDKIKAVLVEKYKGKSLSKTYLDDAASFIEGLITTEEEIEGKVNELDPMLLATMKEADKRATEAAKKAAPKEETKKEEEVKEEEKPDTTPEWAKSLIAEVQTIKAEKIATTTQEKFKKLVDGVPEKFYKHIAITGKTDEELTALAEELKIDFKDYITTETETQMTGYKPTSGQKTGGNVKQASKAEIKEITKHFQN